MSRVAGTRLGAVTVPVVAALLLALLAGCTTDDPPTVDPPGAQPLSGPDGGFADGFFSDLPRLRGATDLSPPVQRHGVISQSFLAHGATHQQVVDFYVENLGDAQRIEPTRPISPASSVGPLAR